MRLCGSRTPPPLPSKGAVVDTLAGTGAVGFADGAGTTAESSHRFGLTHHPVTGSILVTNQGAATKTAPASCVPALSARLPAAGSSASRTADAAAASISRPHGVAADARGSVLVAEALTRQPRALHLRNKGAGGGTYYCK